MQNPLFNAMIAIVFQSANAIKAKQERLVFRVERSFGVEYKGVFGPFGFVVATNQWFPGSDFNNVAAKKDIFSERN